jgi:hypothetical protein
MRRIAAVTSLAFLATLLTPIFSAPAVATPTITTCTDSANSKTIVLKEDKEKCRPFQAAAIWRTEQSDTSINSGQLSATLRVCSSKNPLFSYKFIKSKCPKFQITTDYRRAVVKPQTPLVISAAANGHSAAALLLATDTSTVANHAPIAYYLITNLKSNEITKVAPDFPNRLFISGLNPLTTYTFQIAAVNIDGTSPLSLITPEIRTTAVPVAAPAPAAAPALAAPAFTISSVAETKTVNNVITGYTIDSSGGGTVASYSISPAAPAGLTFSTSTGLLSGTPTSVASATAYTITATNASGSTTRTFTLTVTAIIYSVGDTGPGGGKIFYVAPSPFACGPTRASSCTYLEAAPSGWNTGTDPNLSWATNSNNNQTTTVPAPGAIQTAIGTGYQNSNAIVAQTGNVAASSAAALADSYTSTGTGGTYDDWYLPSKDELNQMCKWQRGIIGVDLTTLTTRCDTGLGLNSGTGAAGFVAFNYWSSSEATAGTAWRQDFNTGVQFSNDKYYNSFYVRPVRSF